MAGFVNNNQIIALTGAYLRHFDTFKKLITVIKEPIRTIVTSNTTNSPVFGYGEESQPSSSFTYTSVTGIFSAQVTEVLNQKAEEIIPGEVKNVTAIGTIRIKIQQDAKDFIEDGRKTEAIQYGGQTFNVVNFDGLQNFFGLKFYTYFLQRSD